MSFEKAPEMMLELARRMPDVHVTLAGDGPMLEQLRSDARQQGLRNVTFAGQVGRDRLGRLVQRAAAVVITSRWLENSTMSMLEGMGAGRCVIVPDRGPLKEWVCDGQTGRLYRPDDLTSLEQVVGEVLSDAAGRKRMDEAAARLVARRHDPQRIAERLEILYEEAIRRCALRW
jgi:glycosyltransferase involved in cell wall biosynthesis